MKRADAVAFLIALPCCAPHAAELPPLPEGMAQMFVLRPSGRTASSEIAIFVGDRLMGACAGRQYLTFAALPGAHV